LNATADVVSRYVRLINVGDGNQKRLRNWLQSYSNDWLCDTPQCLELPRVRGATEKMNGRTAEA